MTLSLAIRPLPAAAICCALALVSPVRSAPPEGLAPELLAERAELAAGYMMAAQRLTGFFEYEYDILRGEYRAANNIVRQAGAAFAIAEYASVLGGPAAAASAKAAVAAFAGISVPFQDGRLVSETGKLEDAPTGATALALLAELHYFDATGDESFSDARRAWLRALMRLQRSGGGFAARPGTEEESAYYNGETWLALAAYHRLFPSDEAVADMLARAEPYLIDRYGEPSRQFAHWGLMAASLRFLTTNEARLIAFIASQSEGVLTELYPEFKPAGNACSIVEGLAAAATALAEAGGHDELVGRIKERVRRELANSLELQIVPGQKRIDFGPDRFLEDPRLDEFAGAFLNGRYWPHARIDFVQHCLSAIMKYRAQEAAETR